MEVVSRKDMETLTRVHGEPAVSLYLPTHPTGNIEQDPIRLKNLLQKAEAHLIEYGLRPSAAGKLLNPALRFINDSLFWQHQGSGLAIFLSKEVFRYYRVPYEFRDLVIVATHFHVKPLLPLFSDDGVFYILALSQNQVRLLQCTRYLVQDVTPGDIPGSLAEALKYDQPEKHHQFHTIGPKGSTIFHGQGTIKNYNKANILRYFQQINRGLREVLWEEHTPLILAAVDFLHYIYREANSYRYLSDEGIKGNPDGLSNEELKEQGWAILQPFFKQRRDEALEKYHEAVTRGQTTDDITRIVPAAYDGRIAILFVAGDIDHWGKYDSKTREVRLYSESMPGVGDLSDLSVANTLTKGGTVYTVEPGELPGKITIAALLRS